MKHYKNYTKYLEGKKEGKALSNSVDLTISKIVPDYIEKFDFTSRQNGLLLGNVQSGKTSHALGIIASAADHDFNLFILLTTDNNSLQQQTFKRALCLDTFNVCGESDDVRFLSTDMRNPALIVLKKNSIMMRRWIDNINSSGFATGGGVFVVDDEGDAASLNTRINTGEQSTINSYVSDFINMGNSSFYLQVTATPQSLFLQEAGTAHRPEFVSYIEPGEGYLGGDFFYSRTDDTSQFPYPIRFIDENELEDLREGDKALPEGMQRALASFLISAAHLVGEVGKPSCNFLIHPSLRIDDHETIADSIGGSLNSLLQSMRGDESSKELLRAGWDDLYETKSHILPFEKCYELICDYLEEGKIQITMINSRSQVVDFDKFEKGIHVIVGGNSLGRGVTFPNLQTTYYCRRARTTQADTSWQHCRAFGYDRDPGLVRMFIPEDLFYVFAELNHENNAMIEYIKEHGHEGFRLISVQGTRPTRPNVLNAEQIDYIDGGRNYFPFMPTPDNRERIDEILSEFGDENEYKRVSIKLIKDVLGLCISEGGEEWQSEKYLNCIQSLGEDFARQEAILIVRRERAISRGTGTLLSPDDRRLGASFPSQLVLTLYRVQGLSDQGWSGEPLWIPNIKFPVGRRFVYNARN